MKVVVNMIKVTKESGNRYKFNHENERVVLIGVAEMLEDGFYYFWFYSKDGCIAAYSLREIAGKLDELNREWQSIVDNITVHTDEEIRDLGF